MERRSRVYLAILIVVVVMVILGILYWYQKDSEEIIKNGTFIMNSYFERS